MYNICQSWFGFLTTVIWQIKKKLYKHILELLELLGLPELLDLLEVYNVIRVMNISSGYNVIRVIKISVFIMPRAMKISSVYNVIRVLYCGFEGYADY